ncbi:phage tail protein [Pseudomonas sp. HMWF032]|uniref:phage tail protein n=1 Tax=Pseudomonas sp. HMWF032 TaxID=2056866 RepID=UPI000D352FD0|nr:phage tail protein [Pseudomonas sp. HMWF032]PTS86437.1 phage tail protein [Pseudomonas sp. HMWF032]PTT81374.1 phage tail protein [Pseudomonas sp. HMWF010]
MVITPSTELEAINEIISIVGESPLNSLEDEANVDALNAQRLLQGVSREVQQKGWSWNTENTSLTPDSISRKITYRDDWLKLLGASLVRRDGYLYSLVNQTNRFTSPVQVEIVRLISFEDLPEAARLYVTHKAKRKFQARYLGAQELAYEAAGDETEAWAALNEFELDFGQYNQIDSDPHVVDVMAR